ncbi:MAG TPA: mannose-6-phosphate isomerase, class I, partial [Rugosimonospora sp.]|nr:mannose-6-phosphate isomerase, class I [Rugosimonospora sp.]
LANSDNVLRGGFTRKPVNVPELLRVLRFEVLDDPLVRPVTTAPGLVTWPVPVRDFALYRAEPGEAGRPVEVPVAGPAVVLCVAGSVTVDDGTGPLALASGGAGLARAGAKAVTVSGAGTAFVATTGL